MDITLTVHMQNMIITTIPIGKLTSDVLPHYCNSSHHDEDEVSRIQELIPDIPLTEPPRDLYSFSHYVDLIAASQNIAPENQLQILLPNSLAREMLDMQQSWKEHGHLDISVINKVVEEFENLPSAAGALGTAFPLSGNNSRGWFVRLENTSPKDSGTEMPVTSLHQLVTMLATSARAREDFEHRVQSELDVIIYLRPWNPDLGTGVEFRVFVPPVDGDAELEVKAISQYHWHVPFPLNDFHVRDTAILVSDAAITLLNQILETAETKGIKRDIEKWGLCFDVVVMKDGDVELIDINAFGVMGSCGSCLFHWLKDVMVLYGKKELIEVRMLA